MTRKGFVLAAIAMVVMLATVGFCGLLSPVWAAETTWDGQQCRVVTIQSNAGISHPTLQVKKGTCVVWLNYTRGEDVRVVFPEGQKCLAMTKSPVGFKMDAKGCYVTEYLDFGRTSSLLFTDAGTFKYEIELQGAGSQPVQRIGFERSGTIIVE